MQRCLELSALPKSHGVKSVRFKRTTPGSIGYFVNANKPPSKHRVVDPSHPALDYTSVQFAQAFPWRTYPGFALRAIPKGLLDKPPVIFPDPPFTFAPVPRWDAGDGQQQRPPGAGSVSMSLMNVASKGTGGRVLKVTGMNKFKTAVSLVAARNADVVKGKDGQERIVFRDEQAGNRWVLSDWTYLCRPSLEVNRMPYTALILALRDALKTIVLHGQYLEQQWQGRNVDVSQHALPVPPQKQAQVQKRVSRRNAVAADPVKQGATVQQLLRVIRTAPAVPGENSELDSESSSPLTEAATSSPSPSSAPWATSSAPLPPAQQSYLRPEKSASSPVLDAMLKRMRSRLSTPSRDQTATGMPPRIRGDTRTPVRGPATRARS